MEPFSLTQYIPWVKLICCHFLLTVAMPLQGIAAERVLPVRDPVQHQPVPRLAHPRRQPRTQTVHARRRAPTGNSESDNVTVNQINVINTVSLR